MYYGWNVGGFSLIRIICRDVTLQLTPTSISLCCAICEGTVGSPPLASACTAHIAPMDDTQPGKQQQNLNVFECVHTVYLSF